MKKTLKKVGLYDPYLDVLGGGEKYLLSILKVLEEEGFELNIFWDKDLSKEIDRRFSLQFFNKLKWRENIFKKKIPFWQKALFLRQFDVFFYISDGSYFFSLAKKNFLYAMVPQKKLYRSGILNTLKQFNWRFITHSRFNQKILEDWGIRSELIYPYLNDNFLNLDLRKIKKEKIILSVGRFFSQLHQKNHRLMIDFFKRLREEDKVFGDFKLVLVGGLKKEDEYYFQEIQSLAKNDPFIAIKPNVSFIDLYRLYQRATFYWHFTGYGIDEKKYPHLVEHLGITPLEAMATGGVVFCYRAGGPKEIINDGINGFLFSSKEELINKMKKVINDQLLKLKIVNKAQNYVRENFSYPVFRKQVRKILPLNQSRRKVGAVQGSALLKN